MTEMTLEIEKQENESAPVQEYRRPRRRYIPRVDIFENDNAVFLTLDMPGVGEDSVDLTLEKNVLTVVGAIEEFAPAGYELNYREYRVGDYRRTFSLSDELDRDLIRASMKNGVMRITLPKVEEITQAFFVIIYSY